MTRHRPRSTRWSCSTSARSTVSSSPVECASAESIASLSPTTFPGSVSLHSNRRASSFQADRPASTTRMRPNCRPGSWSRDCRCSGSVTACNFSPGLPAARCLPPITASTAPPRSVIEDSSTLFAGLPTNLDVWMSHGDHLPSLPPGFKVLASSKNSPVAAMERGSVVGIQFHPEVVHTPRGKEILTELRRPDLWVQSDLVGGVVHRGRHPGDPRAGRRWPGPARTFRRRRFVGRGRPDPPGDWGSVDARLRR